jgi:hypothetical protein
VILVEKSKRRKFFALTTALHNSSSFTRKDIEPGKSKLANVGCPNGLKFPQILVNALEVKYA